MRRTRDEQWHGQHRDQRITATKRPGHHWQRHQAHRQVLPPGQCQAPLYLGAGHA